MLKTILVSVIVSFLICMTAIVIHMSMLSKWMEDFFVRESEFLKDLIQRDFRDREE